MAIDDLLDEHEQGERVRGWLRENGSGVLTGILLGLALILGWQWWMQQRAHQRVRAGDDYQAAIQALQSGKADVAHARIAALPKGSAYAALGAMALAKSQAEAGKRDDAIATLRALEVDDAALAGVVRQRLGQLLVDAGKPKDAVALLAGAKDAPLAAAIRGDAYVAMGQLAEARTAYNQALSSLPVGSPVRNIVELKLIDAGGTPANAEARS
jgi:predicted negative regulator of RcsB-dependent stress response